jgi:hypothetical protein
MALVFGKVVLAPPGEAEAGVKAEVIPHLFAGFSPGCHAVGGLHQEVFLDRGLLHQKVSPGPGLLHQHREKNGMKQMFSKNRPVSYSSGWTRSISGLRSWRGKNKF